MLIGILVCVVFFGKVIYCDVWGGYGNFIELIYKDGISSWYVYFYEYGDGIELGLVV